MDSMLAGKYVSYHYLLLKLIENKKAWEKLFNSISQAYGTLEKHLIY